MAEKRRSDEILQDNYVNSLERYGENYDRNGAIYCVITVNIALGNTITEDTYTNANAAG